MNLVPYDFKAAPEYVDQVVDALIAESPELQGQSDVDREIVRKTLELSPAIRCLIHVVDEELLAVAILAVGPIWYAPCRTCARDLLIWIAPAWRGSSLGIRLIRAVEDWAKANEITDLFLSQSTGIEVERTAGFYSRLGYTVSGFISHKRI